MTTQTFAERCIDLVRRLAELTDDMTTICVADYTIQDFRAEARAILETTMPRLEVTDCLMSSE